MKKPPEPNAGTGLSLGDARKPAVLEIVTQTRNSSAQGLALLRRVRVLDRFHTVFQNFHLAPNIIDDASWYVSVVSVRL